MSKSKNKDITRKELEECLLWVSNEVWDVATSCICCEDKRKKICDFFEDDQIFLWSPNEITEKEKYENHINENKYLEKEIEKLKKENLKLKFIIDQH